MDKWKRIIEPAGDSESSGWSSDDSSCSLTHYRLSQYYNSKMRTHTQEGRVSARGGDDNPVGSCWQDFSEDYRGQAKKIRLSNVSQVNLNCSTSVVTLDRRESTSNIESTSKRSDMYNANEETWDVENEESATRPFLRNRYESAFFNKTSKSYKDAESSGRPSVTDRNVVNSPSIEARSKCFSHENRDLLQSSSSTQQNVEVRSTTDGGEEVGAVVETNKSTLPQSAGITSDSNVSVPTAENTTNEGQTNEKESEQQKDDGQLPNMDLNQSLISLLECPVCMEYVFPPINQCKRGHLVCANCKLQLSSCPTCRSRFNETRNLAMEQVAEKLYFPCRNHASGCKGMYLLQNKREHEANCHFRTYKCIVSHCLWKGFQPDILGHMVEVHKKIVVYGENQVLRLKLDTCVHFTQNWIVSAFNEVFRVNFLVSYLRSHIAGCVQYLGPRKYACNYSYTFDISTDNRRLLYSRQTHGDTGRLLNVYGTGDCFFLRTDAANYFVSDKVIKVTLQIKKIANESVGTS